MPYPDNSLKNNSDQFSIFPQNTPKRKGSIIKSNQGSPTKKKILKKFSLQNSKKGRLKSRRNSNFDGLLKEMKKVQKNLESSSNTLKKIENFQKELEQFGDDKILEKNEKRGIFAAYKIKKLKEESVTIDSKPKKSLFQLKGRFSKSRPSSAISSGMRKNSMGRRPEIWKDKEDNGKNLFRVKCPIQDMSNVFKFENQAYPGVKGKRKKNKIFSVKISREKILKEKKPKGNIEGKSLRASQEKKKRKRVGSAKMEYWVKKPARVELTDKAKKILMKKPMGIFMSRKPLASGYVSYLSGCGRKDFAARRSYEVKRAMRSSRASHKLGRQIGKR